MPIQRKVEVHRLTVSGLNSRTEYTDFFASVQAVRDQYPNLTLQVFNRSHFLEHVSRNGDLLKLRFASYATGVRADVIDTTDHSITQSPIGEAQATLSWTHVLGGVAGNRYLLLIEFHGDSMRPGTIAQYLQFLIDRDLAGLPENANGNDVKPPITVNLEAEASAQFIASIESLKRITQATILVVRPNPGWHDSESDINKLAEESDAKEAKLTLTSRRSQTLQKQKGIVQIIKEKAEDRTLDGAEVRGETEGKKEEKFSTRKSVIFRNLFFDLDDRGQVAPESAWDQMAKYLKTLS